MADEREILYALLGQYTTLIEYDAGGNPIYVGKAAPGTATSAAAWQIRKIAYDLSGNPTAVLWAEGSDGFAYVWDGRAGYTYS
jgi:YD repeat-containing protein